MLTRRAPLSSSAKNLDLCRTADGESASAVSRTVRTLSHRRRRRDSLASDLLALLPCDVSAECCVELDHVIVILDRLQFVFFAQFNRHQPGSPSEFGAMALDIGGELIDIRASIVGLDQFGAVCLIGAEGPEVRCFSGIEITPWGITGKCEGRYFYIA
ncbi:hypothetical protein SAMN05414139_09629 [Burkholderia sp. D7]|nr:hypothetical protein SAMN05414139_09629 [Burkholderia sp. D7]